jgi:glycosyltransferase involved in cell wall biosynthesis
MNKMGRLSVTHIITGLADGGAEAVLFRLCMHDDANRHVVISLMDEGKYGLPLLQAGIDVHCLAMSRGKITLGGLARLWRLVRAQRPDVVQTWMYHADLIGGVTARLAGVRTVCWGIRHSNLEPGTSKRSTIWIARLCAALSHFVPRHIVCCSLRAAEVHQALGYSARKVTVIPNGYNLGHFAPDAEVRERLRAEWGVDDSVPLIGMVARFDPQKNHANLISALGRLKRAGQAFRCVLIGMGIDSDNAELGDWLEAEDVADRVLLLGTRDDIPAVMNALDVHALSSLGEAFPNVLAEAMACGTPCVTTDVGDSALIVGGTGWVVPSGEPEALARGLCSAFAEWRDHAAWRARQREARQSIVKHFSLEKMLGAYRAVWRQAATKRQ